MQNNRGELAAVQQTIWPSMAELFANSRTDATVHTFQLHGQLQGQFLLYRIIMHGQNYYKLKKTNLAAVVSFFPLICFNK